MQDTLDFISYSKKCREDFLDILSNLKEKNMELIPREEDFFYLQNVYKEYEKYLHKLHEDYNKLYNLDIKFDSICYDFLTTIKAQCDDSTVYTRDQKCQNIACIEYNIAVDIHKFAYELYSINHTLNETDFFHGTSLSELLENNLTTTKKFREESFYDIDNFNHITLPDDIDYLVETDMIDIYLLALVSDVDDAKDYDDFFNIMYTFNRNSYISKTLYRYFITLEDLFKMKKSVLKNITSTLIIMCVILSIMIMFAYYIINK